MTNKINLAQLCFKQAYRYVRILDIYTPNNFELSTQKIIKNRPNQEVLRYIGCAMISQQQKDNLNNLILYYADDFFMLVDFHSKRFHKERLKALRNMPKINLP